MSNDKNVENRKNSFYEFFAGGGMARAGLGPEWRCLFANDFDYKKSRVYRENWGAAELISANVCTLKANDIPGYADLAWASFPCQDLSLAGSGAGLKGKRSGTFWPFWNLMKSLSKEKRAPKIIVLENVCGALTSHGGKDFVAIGTALQQLSYRFGALVVDAALFVPQSRPRLFIIAIQDDVEVPSKLIAQEPSDPWHTRALQCAFEKLSTKSKRNWIWWRLPEPPKRKSIFADLIENNPDSVEWHTLKETTNLLNMMSPVNLSKVHEAKKSGVHFVGGLYRRTRKDEFGRKVQRAEVRFDDLAGCLRTPTGGSSRQLILVVDGNQVKSRLLSSRETARLMGLPDTYILPDNYNEAYHLTGDGVVVPVVRHLAKHLFESILSHAGALAAREAA